jgi:hypothetical protein
MGLFTKRALKKKVVQNHPTQGDLAINTNIRGDLTNPANLARNIKT